MKFLLTSDVNRFRFPVHYTETIDNQGDVGRYVSLGIDPAGNPTAVCYDSINKFLKFAEFVPTLSRIHDVIGIGELKKDGKTLLQKCLVDFFWIIDRTELDKK